MPKPFAVLQYLVEHAGRLVTHDELLTAIRSETHVQPEVLRRYIREIRRVLGDQADTPGFIETLTKRGYRFIADVTTDEAKPTAMPSSVFARGPRKRTIIAAAAILARASSDIRKRLGESSATVRKFDTPLVQAVRPLYRLCKSIAWGIGNSRERGTPAPLYLCSREL
jgi:DNA-binding winged helix-turn-helix (wHTH) protein